MAGVTNSADIRPLRGQARSLNRAATIIERRCAKLRKRIDEQEKRLKANQAKLTKAEADADAHRREALNIEQRIAAMQTADASTRGWRRICAGRERDFAIMDRLFARGYTVKEAEKRLRSYRARRGVPRPKGPICKCGECQTCRHREIVRTSRAKQQAEQTTPPANGNYARDVIAYEMSRTNYGAAVSAAR